MIDYYSTKGKSCYPSGIIMEVNAILCIRQLVEFGSSGCKKFEAAEGDLASNGCAGGLFFIDRGGT